MNRILYEQSEVSGGIVAFGGERAAHVANILHAEPGGRIKSGVIDGAVGTSLLLEVSPERVVARVEHGRESLAPWADVVLAPPRPRVFKRLLPQLAALGARNIVLVGAAKVEKDFWGATVLKEENFRPLLIDGLMQAGASILPRVLVRRNFRRFIDEELDSILDPGEPRFVAHPSADASGGLRTPPDGASSVCVAVGPEGGWTPAEVELLEERAFARCSLGPRILKTETACIALLSRLMP